MVDATVGVGPADSTLECGKATYTGKRQAECALKVQHEPYTEKENA